MLCRGNSWQLGYVKDESKKAGRVTLLDPVVLLAIHSAINRLITSGVETYSVVIRPIVRQCIIDGGQKGLLAENGGNFLISSSWINKLCRSMGLVMRRGTTAAQKVPLNWEELVKLLNQRVAALQFLHNIPKGLVVNWDQTAIRLCPVSGSSRAQRGVHAVQLIAHDDKRQITAVFAAAADGTLLPPQLIFKGTTKQSWPSSYFKNGPGNPGKQNEGGLLDGRVAKFAGYSWSSTYNHWSSQVRWSPSSGSLQKCSAAGVDELCL